MRSLQGGGGEYWNCSQAPVLTGDSTKVLAQELKKNQYVSVWHFWFPDGYWRCELSFECMEKGQLGPKRKAMAYCRGLTHTYV